MSVHVFPAPTAPTIVTFEDDYSSHSSNKTPIVIDNGARDRQIQRINGQVLSNRASGATEFRYGWATATSPYTGLNAMAKYKERKTNKLLLLFGDAVEADAASRLATKTTWEGDIIANPEAMVRR